MNYRHIYHAGNFADVFKHCLLISLAQHLLKKDKPILYLDTHAGIGKYDLTTTKAQKAKEYERGIGRIYNLSGYSPVIQTYQNIVRTNNTATEQLHYYPGSPLILRALMRHQDSMILTELHHEDIQTLKQYFYQDKQVAVHYLDGYQSLKAFLPPNDGRSLILIDPPFEEKDEFAKITAGLQIALERFSHGVYLIWYPIKDQLEVKKFHAQIKNINCKNILATELSISKKVTNSGLTSCGLTIINVPWQFELELKSLVSWLSNHLKLDSTGEWQVKWIKK